MLHFLNAFFFAFHTAWTLFNIGGWAWARLRKWHLLTMLLTAGSWFILGIWYGWGYCVCTDWHYQVRERLGYHDQEDSYVRFLLRKLTGIAFDAQLVDNATGIVFVVSLALSIWLNVRDYRRKRRENKKAAG
jgi:hypothetical protein